MLLCCVSYRLRFLPAVLEVMRYFQQRFTLDNVSIERTREAFKTVGRSNSIGNRVVPLLLQGEHSCA